MSPSPPLPSPSPPHDSPAPLPIHTYHCLCSTLLLATPYLLSSLPTRAPPSHDHARILPLPPFQHLPPDAYPYLPSLLLPALRPTRKLTLVQREDGYERRRVWRCARCGLGIAYEIEHPEEGGKGGEEERLRVLFVMEEGLVTTESISPVAQAGEKTAGQGVEEGGRGSTAGQGVEGGRAGEGMRE